MFFKIKQSVPRLTLFPLITVLINACAMVEKDAAMQMERTLHAAGFRMVKADNEDKISYLQGLPQRTLFAKQKQGELHYIYADADYCRCLYRGTEADYRHYQKLARQQQLLETKIESAGQLENTPLDWNTVDDWTLRP